ncbi:hypothetical protein HPB47_027570 [Ixodes persulcatus]|uniref:Uncharacterized protein n=1 Tax=Ixodes persulcatus TaxID=34615 RepID=A0AC60PW50_IXOPE|nr:hypothetical protein HPB47_027570 [Ixodes persulcatus]
MSPTLRSETKDGEKPGARVDPGAGSADAQAESQLKVAAMCDAVTDRLTVQQSREPELRPQLTVPYHVHLHGRTFETIEEIARHARSTKEIFFAQKSYLTPPLAANSLEPACNWQGPEAIPAPRPPRDGHRMPNQSSRRRSSFGSMRGHRRTAEERPCGTTCDVGDG